MDIVISVDIGTTSIAALALAARTGEILARLAVVADSLYAVRRMLDGGRAVSTDLRRALQENHGIFSSGSGRA